MDLQTFFAEMEQRGLRPDPESASAYGMIQGWPVRICHGRRGQAKSLTAVVNLGGADWKSLKKDYKQRLKGIAQAQPGSGGTLVLVTKRAGEENPAVRCDLALDALWELLAEREITPPTACPVCGGGDCDVLVGMGQGCTPAHEHCLTDALEQSKLQAETSRKSGSYLAGVIGALLGGIVGCIPSVLSVIWAERVYAILFALIPLAAFYGYKLLGGRLNGAARWITIGVSLVMIYVMEFVFVVAGIMMEYEATLGDAMFLMSLAIGEMGWPAILWELTQSAGVSFVFLALGVWIAWQQISHTDMDTVHTLERVRETMQPIPGREKDESEEEPAPQAEPVPAMQTGDETV